MINEQVFRFQVPVDKV